MLFNSINFAIFLPAVFILYWLAARKSIRQQNILLLVASYFFYASWDWRFLFLLIFSTSLDFITGLKIYSSNEVRRKKLWLWISIVVNVGFLGVFKYFNFFATSFTEAISRLGFQVNPWSLKVILPVGISFYTFHGLSYVFDIYNGKIKAERNFVNYAVFVSFFPLLVAGPIERATHLLPQIKQKRIFNYAQGVDGLKQILWGLFKKMVIADRCAAYVNMIFGHYSDYSGATLFLGAVFFAFQIYGDFSGYSDIALGTAKLFGINLLRNFAFPYFSRDIAEFWRRWHISLSSWFRDYLYIPLGGSRGGIWMRIRNTLAIFLVSGFWHGANWTFIVWGFLNALYMMPLIIFQKNRKNLDLVAQGRYLPTAKEAMAIISTFFLTVLAWIFFRSDTVSQAVSYLKKLLTGLFDIASYLQLMKFYNRQVGLSLSLIIIGFFVIEWLGRDQQYAIARVFATKSTSFRWAFYYALIFLIFLFAGTRQEFIYFQF